MHLIRELEAHGFFLEESREQILSYTQRKMIASDDAFGSKGSTVASPLQRDYWAFISYRHADNKEPGRQWATWLHQALETYEIPEDLVGSKNERGDVIPERIFPVFRDEEELPADAELSTPIEGALQRSAFLVVLCSPKAVASQFVADEILRFKQLGKEKRILAAIIGGEPNSGGDTECFPKPLRFDLGDDGQLSTTPSEPIAADFRLPDGTAGWTSPAAYRDELKRNGIADSESKRLIADLTDRQNLMLLKIIAGIIGVPLGTLTDRDKAYQLAKQKKRTRQLRVWLALVSIITLIAVYFGYQSSVTAEREAAARKKVAGTLSRVFLERGVSLLSSIDSDSSRRGHQGIGYLCEALETDPDNWEARARLITALKSRRWPHPILRTSLRDTLTPSGLMFSQDGSKLFVEGNDRSVDVLDTGSLNKIASYESAEQASESRWTKLLDSPSRGLVRLERIEEGELFFLGVSNAETGETLLRLPCSSFFAEPAMTQRDEVLVLSSDGRMLDLLDLKDLTTRRFRNLEETEYIGIGDPDVSGIMGAAGTWVLLDGVGGPFLFVDDERLYFLNGANHHSATELARFFGSILSGKTVVGTCVDAKNYAVWIATEVVDPEEAADDYLTIHRFTLDGELEHHSLIFDRSLNGDERMFSGVFDISLDLATLDDGESVVCALEENSMIAVVSPPMRADETEASVTYLRHSDAGLAGVSTLLHAEASKRLISISADSNVIISTDRSEFADDTEARLAKEFEVIPLSSPADPVAVSADGKFLAICRQGFLEIYDLEDLGSPEIALDTGAVMTREKSQSVAELPAIRKDIILPAQFLNTASDDQYTLIREAGKAEVFIKKSNSSGEGNDWSTWFNVDLSPDESHVVISDFDHALLVDLKKSEIVSELKHSAHSADGADFHLKAVFSPDSKRFITVNGDSTIKLYDTASAQLVCEPIQLGWGSNPYDIVFSSDSAVFMAEDSNFVRFFASQTGTEVYEPISVDNAGRPDGVDRSEGFLMTQTDWSDFSENGARQKYYFCPFWHSPQCAALRDELLILSGKILCGFELNSDGVASPIPLERRVKMEQKLAKALGLQRLDWEKVADGWLLQRPFAIVPPREENVKARDDVPETLLQDSPVYVLIPVETEMSFTDFAVIHGTTTAILNELNGLDLADDVSLAVGSELYVPK